MSRRFSTVLIAVAAFSALLGGEAARGQTLYLWVNTTEDLPIEPGQCLPQQPCTLRSAIEQAERRQSVITACFEPEAVPGARPCPAGALPLTTQDPNYDPATGRWTLTVGAGNVSFVLSSGRTGIDFSYGLEGWGGPQDNRIALDPDVGREPGADPRTDVILIEGTDNVLKGFEIRGSYQIAAVIVRKGAANNQFGPGLVLAGMPEGSGIHFENRDTVGNKVVGIWCGLTGDGTVVDPVRDDCLRFASGASASVVGGESPEDRNVLVGSELGAAVSVEGIASRDITVQGNYLGVGLDGRTAIGNEAGIRVTDGPSGVRLLDNVVSGNRNNGIAVFGDSTGLRIERNRIGVAADEDECVSNAGVGITLQGGVAFSTIGENVVHCNLDGGIVLRDALIQDVRITRNSISRNGGVPLVVAEGANLGVKPPSMLPETATKLVGRTCPGCTVEVYSDPAGEAEVFEGAIEGDEEDGTFVFEKDAFAYRAIRATSTDGGNTSGLSPVIVRPGGPRPSETPFGYRTPTPTPTLRPEDPTPTPPGLFFFSFLPWVHDGPMRLGRGGGAVGR